MTAIVYCAPHVACTTVLLPIVTTCGQTEGGEVTVRAGGPFSAPAAPHPLRPLLPVGVAVAQLARPGTRRQRPSEHEQEGKREVRKTHVLAPHENRFRVRSSVAGVRVRGVSRSTR